MKISKNGKYSQKKFLDTHKKILKHSSNFQNKNKDSLKEKLSFLTECLIWGDQNDDSIFEFDTFSFLSCLFLIVNF